MPVQTRYQIAYRILLVVLTIQSNCACVVLPNSTDDTLHEWKKHVNRARSLIKLKEYSKAQSEYQTAFDVLGHDESTRIFEALTAKELGSLYMEEGLDSKAESEFKDACNIFSERKKKDPDTYDLYLNYHFEALSNLAELEARSGRAKEALEDYKNALYLSNSNESKERCQVRILELQEATGTANKHSEYTHEQYQAVMKLMNNDQENRMLPLMTQCRAFSENGDMKQARQYLFAALDWGKQHNNYDVQAFLYSELIRMHYRMGELDRAADLCQLGISLAPKNEKFNKWQPEYMTALSIIQKRRGEADRSEKTYAYALQLAETDGDKVKVANTLDLLAAVEVEQGRPDFADSELQKAKSIIQGLPDEKELQAHLQGEIAQMKHQRKLK